MYTGYEAINYDQIDYGELKICYLCQKKLSGKTSLDHIIPQGLFEAHAPNKPQFKVHAKCNNHKSFEDEFFIRQIQLMSALNVEAEQEVRKLLKKALLQKESTNLIGKSDKIRDYRKVIKLLDKNSWGMQVVMNGQVQSVLNLGEENSERTSKYIENLCLGLYIRNVPNSNPRLENLLGVQYAGANLQNKLKQFTDIAQPLVSQSGFGQKWSKRTRYTGNFINGDINKGFIFVEFYEQVAYLALFKGSK